MTNSKNISALVGPTLIAVLASENPFVNPHLYDHQIAPVVYLSGALLFVAGLSIIRNHNLWTFAWPVLITLIGWMALLLGLFRMFAPRVYEQGAQGNTITLLAFEIVGFAVGIFLTLKAYWAKD